MAEELQYTLEPKTNKVQDKEQDAASVRSDSTKILICKVYNTLNDEPLLILDGIPVKPAMLNQYKIEDIKDIKILKGAKATALYGARASKGVILLYSKKN
ncbi:TonB-dependent receptor plug domain-containing protein [Sinomicrobium sp. M5D2P17]